MEFQLCFQLSEHFQKLFLCKLFRKATITIHIFPRVLKYDPLNSVYMVGKRKKSCRVRSDKQAGCSRTTVKFVPRTPWQKNALCEGTLQGAGTTCQETILASRSEPTVSDVQNLEINLLVDSLTRSEKLLVHCPFAVKETGHIVTFLYPHFLGVEWACRFLLYAQLLCLGVILKNLTLISNDDCSAIFHLYSLQKFSTNFFPFLYLHTNFPSSPSYPSKSVVKYLYLYSFVSADILTARYWSFRTSSHFYDVFIWFCCCQTSRSAVKLNFVPSFGKPLHHSETHALDIICSQYTCFNISKILVGFLPS